jgi:hypothetical protein
VISLALGIGVAFAGARSTSSGERRDLPFETVQAWGGLIPEAGDVRLCGFTAAGHALWGQGQLRVPLSPSSVAQGMLTPDRELWVVLLEVGPEPAPCDGLLAVTRTGATWQRLAWQRLDLDPGTVPTAMRWDQTREAILVDTGARTRRTAPATFSWADGGVVQATPGFVIDVSLVRHVLWWRADGSRFEYERLTVPLEIPDAAEEVPCPCPSRPWTS